MSLKNTLLLTAIIAAMSGTLVAGAAEDKGAPGKEGTTVEKAVPDAPKAKKVKPHDHASFHKSGVETAPTANASEASEAPKTLAHDHQKFHK